VIFPYIDTFDTYIVTGAWNTKPCTSHSTFILLSWKLQKSISQPNLHLKSTLGLFSNPGAPLQFGQKIHSVTHHHWLWTSVSVNYVHHTSQGVNDQSKWYSSPVFTMPSESLVSSRQTAIYSVWRSSLKTGKRLRLDQTKVDKDWKLSGLIKTITTVQSLVHNYFGKLKTKQRPVSAVSTGLFNLTINTIAGPGCVLVFQHFWWNKFVVKPKWMQENAEHQIDNNQQLINVDCCLPPSSVFFLTPPSHFPASKCPRSKSYLTFS